MGLSGGRGWFKAAFLSVFSLGAGASLWAQTVPKTVSVPDVARAPRESQSRGIIVLRPTAAANATANTDDATPTPARVDPAPPPQPPTPAPVIKLCARPFAQPDMTAPVASSEIAKFDATLRTKFGRQQPSVVINMATPFALDSGTPPELSPWLTQIKATQGSVTISQYCGDTRGFFAFFSHMFAGSGARRYAGANGYDAVLHVDAIDQRVTQVEFRRRGDR